ncbi:multicilin [Sardina pilchardus]|uniref:multicilin n=1 Tax=Sardina pilchardus TaxID=27697 RepID=UPI002E12D448
MQTCLYTHVHSYGTNHQRDETVDSFENDAILEFITEHTKWMPRISMDASDLISLDADVQPTDLVDSLELNRQLHTTLQRKQDEISALREKNSQLKELARQAEHLAHLLDTMTPSTEETKQAAACSPSSYGLGCSPTEQHLRSLDKHQWVCTATYDSQDTEVFSSAPTQTDQTPECLKPGPASPRTGVKRCLWPSQDDTGSAGEHSSSAEDAVTFQRDAKRRRDDQELLQAQLQQYLEDIEWDLRQEDSVVSREDQAEGQKSDPINICGSFQGLQIVRTTETDSSDRGEPMCFKTSIREHCTIRTRVFPHGKSFTSPTPTGGYRFLWIPTDKS